MTRKGSLPPLKNKIVSNYKPNLNEFQINEAKGLIEIIKNAFNEMNESLE